MINEYPQNIKALREESDISQLEMAEKLGIARSSYIAVEQGKRDLTLTEAQKVADIFGIELNEVEGGAKPDYEKYKEMILAYLRTAGGDDGNMPKTKLAKLLYLADFAWYYENLTSMSGMQYRRIKYGPVPDMYFRAIDELEDEGKISIDRHKDNMSLISENGASERQSLKMLKKNEISLIGKIAKKWKDRRTNEIVLFTHGQLPYTLCAPDEIIPYELITQEDPKHVY